MNEAGRRGRGWPERLVWWSLRWWPRAARERDGHALLEAIRDQVTERAGRAHTSVWWVVGECLSVVRAGAAMRCTAWVEWVRGATRDWARDVRLAVRTLARHRGFSGLAILTLAIGIGGNAAVFALVDQVLFRPAPYEFPDELVLVWSVLGSDPSRVPVAAPDVAVFRERARRFQDFAFINRVVDGAMARAPGAGVEHVRVATITPNLFQLLGVRPVAGRLFSASDIREAGAAEGITAPVVVLSYGIWRSAFAADAGVVGSVVRLNGRPVTVLGVLPARFRLALPPDAGIATAADVWAPLQVPLAAFARDDGRLIDQDSDNSGVAIGRMRSGVAVEDAAAELARIGEQLRREVPGYAAADLRVMTRAMHEDATAHASGLMRALIAGAGLVLLVASLNLSTLVLARSTRRQAELAIRTALGASWPRVVRQLVTENLVLFAIGAILAAAVAAYGTSLLARTMPAGLAPSVAVRWDPVAVLVATAATAVVVQGFGLLPALGVAVRDRTFRIGAGFLRSSHRRTRVRSALVLGQIALSVVLVLGAVFLIRTTFALRDVDPGFEAANALTFSVSLRVPDRHTGPADRARFMHEVETAITALPDVRAVGMTGALPLSGRRWTQPYGLPGQAEAEWQENRADFRVITSGWFEAAGTRLLEGRSFTREEDLVEDMRVVIVDEKLAARIAPAGSAVGATIGFPLDGKPIRARIIGVVEHVRHDDLATEGREALYVPYRQEASRDVSFVVRTGSDSGTIASAIRGVLHAIDPEVPVYAVRRLEEYVDDAVGPVRFALALLTGFAVLTVLAAALGLHGLIAYEVGSRTREIGLRMAIGATARSVLRSVLLNGARLGGVGIAIGALLGVVAARGLRPLLYGVSTRDLFTWTMVLSTVLAVTLLSCWIPARRASRLDPGLALRVD